MTSEAYNRVATHVERHGDKIQAAFSILGMKELLAEIDAASPERTMPHPTHGLPQTMDQLFAERNMLLWSVRGLQAKIERINRLSKSRLTRLRKARQLVAAFKARIERNETAMGIIERAAARLGQPKGV